MRAASGDSAVFLGAADLAFEDKLLAAVELAKNMDVYHKVLARIYEITDGVETAEVDLQDLLKREGFYPSLQSISEHLTNESWFKETQHKFVV